MLACTVSSFNSMYNAHFSDAHIREPLDCTTAVWDFRVTSAYKTAIFLQKYCFCQRKLHQSNKLFSHEVIKNNVAGFDWLCNPPHVLLNHLESMSFLTLSYYNSWWITTTWKLIYFEINHNTRECMAGIKKKKVWDHY